MGCISSKGFGRSMSIHDRFSQGVHALAIGAFPGEDFQMTTREKDRIITLIKIASGKNLRGLRYVEADTDDSTLCKLKPCNDEEERYEDKRRSQISGSTELPESSSAVSESDPNGQGSARCRSFHTLEEFDELLEKIKLFEARIEEANADDGFESKPEEAQPTRDSLDTSPLSEMSSSEARLSLEDNIPGRGWRRKAIGRGLQSLKLPISARAELSTVGSSLKEWIHAGDDIYSPGSYVTPKFGSYVTEDKNFAMFSPELVAVFEECMQQMESEELAIVKLMESEELAD